MKPAPPPSSIDLPGNHRNSMQPGTDLDALYLRSETYAQAVRSDELRSICCCLITNTGYILWDSRIPMGRHLRFAPRCSIQVFFVITGLLQYCWYLRARRSFLKHRTTVRLVNRLLRSLVVLAPPFTARATIRAAATADLTAFLEQQPALLERKVTELLGGAWLFSLKHLLTFSGATGLLSHAVHTTLPLAGQLAFHCSSVLALLALHTAPLAHLMHSVAFSADYRSICTFLNMLLALAQVDIEHSAGSVAHLDGSCHQHSHELAAMFVILYMGLVLPVYLAVRLDGHRNCNFRKELQLRGRSSSAEWGGQSAATSVSAKAKERLEEREQSGKIVGRWWSAAGQMEGGEGTGGEEEMLVDEDGLPWGHYLEYDGPSWVLHHVAMAALLAAITWAAVVFGRQWLMAIVVPL